MKKLLLLLLCVVIVLGIIACKGTVKPAEETGELFVLVTDSKDLTENGDNDLALQGFQRAKEELGVRIETVQTNSADEYLSGIKIAVDKGAALIVCSGFSMTAAVQQAAVEYPDQAFALIDGRVEAPNVSCYTFTEEGGAFLAGVAAATMTETDIIGFVWDVQTPQTEKFQYGFEAGVQSANANAQVLINYTNYAGEALLCKETAFAQNKLGADVIFHGPKGCGEGIIQAAQEQKFWSIGMDKGQFILSPDATLCAVVRGFDLASYMAIEDYNNGVEKGIQHNFSVKNNGVELLDLSENLSEEALAAIKVWKNKIIHEKVVIPYDGATFAQFFLE